MKKSLLALLVIGLAVTVVWLRNDEAGRPSPQPGVPAASTPDPRKAIADNFDEEVSEAAPATLTGTISGMVLSADTRRPVAGVTVTGEWELYDPMVGPHRQSCISDASGRYVLAGASPGRVFLSVLGDGWAARTLTQRTLDRPPARVVVAPGRTTEQDLLVLETARLEGRVLTSFGEPVAGVEVQAFINGLRRGMSDRHSVVTDAWGRFTVENMIPGFEYHLSAQTKMGQVPAPDPAKGKPGEVVETEIRLPVPCLLRVVVTDAETDDPIPEATVTTSLWIGGDIRWAATGPEGVAELSPVPPGSLRITVTSPGYVTTSQQVQIAPTTPAGRELSVTARLSRGADLRGEVRFTEGDGGFPTGLNLDAVLLDGPARGRKIHVRLDASRFVLSDILPGTYELSLWQTERHRPMATTRARTGAEDVIITVDGPGVPPTFTLTILGPDGAPVEGARCIVHHGVWETGPEQKPRQGILEVELKLDLKSFELEIIEAWGANGQKLPPGRHGPFKCPPYRAEIQIGKGRSVSGKVLDENGVPVPEVLLWAYPDEESVIGDFARTKCHAKARSDQEGNFQLDGLASHSYGLKVSVPPGFVAVRWIELPASETRLDLLLRHGRDAEITVVDFHGEPVPGATIYASSSLGGIGVKAQADRAGQAVLEGLDPTFDFRLRIVPPNSRKDLTTLSFDPWKLETRKFQLGRKFTTRGVVLSPDGRPVRHASIWIRKVGGEWGHPRRVAQDGSFTIRGTDNRLCLLATPLGATTEEPGVEEVTVEAGREDVKLILDPGLMLQVNVTDVTPSRPVRAELVSDRDGRRTRFFVVTHPMPLQFRGVYPGERYTLRLIADWGLGHTQSGIRGDVGILEVSPKRAGSVRGHVTFPPGAKRARLRARSDRLSTNGAASPDGRFVIPVLVGSEWTILATATVDGTRWSGSARASAGAEVDIEMKPEPK